MHMVWRRCQNNTSVCIVLTLALCLLSNGAQAELSGVGFRYGKGFQDADFDQYDLFSSMELPWQTEAPRGWVLHSEVEGIAGVLTWMGDTAGKLSIMPSLVLSSPGRKVDIVAGVGLGFMLGVTEFGEGVDRHDLGGPFFLQGQVGFRFNVTDNVFLGYRYVHQSNAGIYSVNDSLNLNQIELGWNY